MNERIPRTEYKPKSMTIKRQSDNKPMGLAKKLFLGVGFVVALTATGKMIYSAHKEKATRREYFVSLPLELIETTDSCAYNMYKRVTKDVPEERIKPTPGEFYSHVCEINRINETDLRNRFPIKEKYELPDYDGKPNTD